MRRDLCGSHPTVAAEKWTRVRRILRRYYEPLPDTDTAQSPRAISSHLIIFAAMGKTVAIITTVLAAVMICVLVKPVQCAPSGTPSVSPRPTQVVDSALIGTKTASPKPLNQSGKQGSTSKPLDLRPPDSVTATDVDGFLVPARRLGTPTAPEDVPALWKSSGARPMSSAEELASRIRQEGLPVARLWQGNLASLSLGLNQKGKPGVWWLQKFH
jgi:hypothetical protein